MKTDFQSTGKNYLTQSASFISQSRWYKAAQNRRPVGKWRTESPPRSKLLKSRFKPEDLNLVDEHGNFKMPRIVEMEDLLEVERREKERIRLAGRDQADTVTWEVRDEKVERALNKLFLIRVLRLSFFFRSTYQKKNCYDR